MIEISNVLFIVLCIFGCIGFLFVVYQIFNFILSYIEMKDNFDRYRRAYFDKKVHDLFSQNQEDEENEDE